MNIWRNANYKLNDGKYWLKIKMLDEQNKNVVLITEMFEYRNNLLLSKWKYQKTENLQKIDWPLVVDR